MLFRSGEKCGDSPKQVQRYIKITELIPEICPISEIGGEKVTLEKACGMGLPEL